jgi:hypothetical protein
MEEVRERSFSVEGPLRRAMSLVFVRTVTSSLGMSVSSISDMNNTDRRCTPNAFRRKCWTDRTQGMT